MTAVHAEATATTQQSNSFQILTCLFDRPLRTDARGGCFLPTSCACVFASVPPLQYFRSRTSTSALIFSTPLQCIIFSAPLQSLHSSASARMPLVSTRLTVCKRIFFISTCNSFIYANQRHADSYELSSRNHSTAVITSLEPQLNSCEHLCLLSHIFRYLPDFPIFASFHPFTDCPDTRPVCKAVVYITRCLSVYCACR